MTDAELDALEAVAKAATPGPWTWNGLSVEADDFDLCSCVDWRSPINRNGMANAAFIAAVNPAIVLDLIAELRQAWKERDWLAGNMPNDICPAGRAECAYRCPTAGGKACYECLLCWLEAARQATTER